MPDFFPPTPSPSTHQVNSVDNDASFAVPQSQSSQPVPSDLDHSRLFRYRKWLWVMAASVIAIGAVIAVIVASQASLPHSTRTNTITPTPGKAAVSTTHSESDDAYFAGLPLTMLYYSFSQTSNSKNVFQANPSDSESRFLNIGFPDKYTFLTSPNGKFLLRWNETDLEIAEAATPAKFISLYKPQGSQIMIRQAVWSTDSSRLALSYTKAPVDTSKFASVVTIIDLAKGESTTVIQTEVDFVYGLKALVDNERLYYVQDRNGLVSNLTEFNTTDKKVSREIPAFNSNGLLAKLSFDRAMSWGYMFENNVVVRHNIATFEKETLYTLDRSCRNGQTNNSAVTSLSVSPTSDQLLFTTVPQACRVGSRDQDLKNRLLLLDIKNKKVVKEVVSPAFTKLVSSSWSPANDVVWAQVDTQTAYGISPSTLDIWPIPPQQRNVLTKERPIFLGWLLPKP